MHILMLMDAPPGLDWPALSRSETTPLEAGLPDPDAVLLARVRAGHQEALRALYEAHHAGLYRFLRANLGREDAEEILQDVFITAWQKASSFRGDSQVSTWLYGIARNLSRNRQRKVQLSWFRYGAELQELEAARALEDTEFLAALEAVSRLPTHERAVVELVALGELPQAEAARLLGIPLGTVKSRLSSARQRLRQALGGQYE